MKQRRVVCAACLFDKGVVLGARHFDTRMHEACKDLYGSERYANLVDVQGFVDNHGLFMDRKEAWIVAEAAGQILYPDIGGGSTGTLYSEHLY